MSLGIKAFGMTPFGWRFVVGVFGVLMTPLFYAFALSIMKKRKYAVATAILLNLEFSHFTLSRIATIDIIVALFILLEFYFMYRFLQYERMYRYEVNGQKDQMAIVQKKEIMYLVLSGISMGCGMATKWTGVYATIGLAIIFFTFMWSGYSEAECRREEFEHLKKLFYICIVSFVVLPIIIYVLSYNPYVRVWNKNVIQCAYENSISMFQYHEKTIFDHPYASDWYEWPWMKTPLFDAIYRYSDGTESMVCTFGNPLIWWGGIIALFHHIYLSMHR